MYCLFACGGEDESYDLLADYDRDGFSIKDGDCDDHNPYIYPQAAEICDSLDNDCDDLIDSNLDIFPSYYIDNDGDGYGTTIVEVDTCDIPFGYSLEGGDCNDSDSTIHPNADSNWDNAFFDEDCDHIVQPILKTSQSNWGVSEQRTLFVVSQENDIQPISISKQSIHLLNFPSGQENSIPLPGLELTSFATDTESGNIAVFAQELLGEDQGILLYDVDELRQYNNTTNYWHGSVGFLSLIGLHITDLKDIGDFLGQGNILGVAARVNDFQYMMFYDELGQILSENPQNWNQSMHWDQGDIVVSENDISNLGERVWSLGDVNNDGYDDIILQMQGSDVLHLIKGSIAPRMSYPYWTLQSELGCQPQVSTSNGGDPIIFCNQDDQTFLFDDYQYGGSADIMSASMQFSKQADDLFYIESNEGWQDDYFAIVHNNQLLFHQQQSGKFQEVQQVGYSFTSAITSNIIPIPQQRDVTNSSNTVSMLIGNNNSIFWLDSPPLR